MDFRLILVVFRRRKSLFGLEIKQNFEKLEMTTDCRIPAYWEEKTSERKHIG